MITEFKRKKKTSRKEIIFWIFFAIISVSLISTLTVANIRMKNKREQYNDQVEKLKKEIEQVEDKTKELEKTSSKVDSKENLERIAREQLGLKSVGEEVVVITKDKEDNTSNWNLTDWWKLTKGERD